MFFRVPDTPAIYGAWERLVIEHEVTGESSHDTRLVAAMQVHGISSILTFDRTGSHVFRLFESCIPRISKQAEGALHSPLCWSILATNAVQPVW
jgi:hypothetical protein